MTRLDFGAMAQIRALSVAMWAHRNGCKLLTGSTEDNKPIRLFVVPHAPWFGSASLLGLRKCTYIIRRLITN